MSDKRFRLLELDDDYRPPPEELVNRFAPGSEGAARVASVPLVGRPSTTSVRSRIVPPPAVSIVRPAPIVAVVPDVPMWRLIDEHTIDVNLDAPPSPPFSGATVAWNTGRRGWVRIEFRSDRLYFEGREIVLHLEESQKTGRIRGHDLYRALEGKDALHPNVLDSLHANARLIPESWKQDEQGRTRYIYFWAAGFRNAGGGLCVRCLYWDDGRWGWDCGWLGSDWDAGFPAAVPAS